ncbi:MAG: bifunctional UDP-N-acetylglucosamine diphosphorylase/glucosamine-1-phosphate N-acetyltransferase GlmU [Geobacteraceae bacterium]|nr:bifunctional UDP-N-acetylglucosamine diphosphorylase/glucosamine-1-phosphate N-acetyltransferase GlmU [Geobacteraceae bacterium]
MSNVAAIILAAGKGTRMKSGLVKVMHRVVDKPMISYSVRAAKAVGAGRLAVVVGHQAQTVRDFFSSDETIVFALQEEQLGTGHAAACARTALEDFSGTVLILCGDVPLLKSETVGAMLENHEKRGAVVTVLTTHLENPFGYGRVVKREGGRISRIVEEKDATPEEREIDEINSGIYCVSAEFLFKALAGLKCDNAQGEYYLTDIVKIAAQESRLCLAFPTDDPTEVMGVNDRVQLAEVSTIMRSRINRGLMLSGTTMIDPAATYIEEGVSIGADTIIHPNVHITGSTVIGTGCIIEQGASIRDSVIGDRVTIKAGSVAEESRIGDEASIGPMAHLRPGTRLGEHVKIGNFVETKKITMGRGSKASHLTYLGDAEIGADVNIGCGTITCNYDGVNKHKTVIGDNVFVGSDVQLVAPVTVGSNSLIAAGTTVTIDVPPDSLAIARTAQVNKVDWVKNRLVKG